MSVSDNLFRRNFFAARSCGQFVKTYTVKTKYHSSVDENAVRLCTSIFFIPKAHTLIFPYEVST